MKNIFIIIAILLLLFSCREKTHTVTEKKYYENGNLAQEISYTSDSTAIVFSYYKNGNLHSIVTYTNQDKDGFYVSFYESGKIQERGFFKKNKKNEEWYYYSKDGLLTAKWQIVNIPFEEDPIVKEVIYYTQDMELDTTKQLCYVEVNTFGDTIYDKEPYFLQIKLHKPYFKNGGMNIMLVDNLSKYYDLSKVELHNLIHCKGFEHLLQIVDYKVGYNEINGVVINYDETGKLEVLVSRRKYY